MKIKQGVLEANLFGIKRDPDFTERKLKPRSFAPYIFFISIPYPSELAPPINKESQATGLLFDLRPLISLSFW